MAKKEFQTNINIGGKVDPSLGTAVNGACKFFKVMKATALGATVGAVAGFVGGKIVSGVKEFSNEMLTAASDLQETQGKISEVFKESSGVLEEWSKTSTKTMGLSKQSALDSAALFGDMATGMNIGRDRAAQMSVTLTQLGADLASFKNTSIDITKTALKGVFTGETESLKNLGVVMTQANLQEFAYSKGIKKKIANMKEAEKVELRYQYVLSKTKNAQGDYVKTAQNAANAQRTMNESIVDLQAKIGENFLPYYAKLLGIINNWLSKNSDKIIEYSIKATHAFSAIFHCLSGIYKVAKSVINFASTVATPILMTLGAIIGGLVTFKTIQAFQMLQLQMALATKEAGLLGLIAKGNLLGALKAVTMATWSSVTAIAAQTAALLANPITWVVIAVGALTAGLVWCALNWDKVTNAVKKATDAVKKFLHIKGDKNITVPVTTTETETKTGHALGANYFVGGETWVGENGPEKIIAPRGSRILSHNQSKQAVGGVSCNNTFNIVIKGNADENTVRTAVSSALNDFMAKFNAMQQRQRRLGYAF